MTYCCLGKLATSQQLIKSGFNGVTVLGVGHADNRQIYPSIDAAVRYASDTFPDKRIWIGGGAKLAEAGFKLLQAQGMGKFYETVVHSEYPAADTFMPQFDETLWTEPVVIQSVDSAVVGGGTTARGLTLPRVTPAYHIQERHVIVPDDNL